MIPDGRQLGRVAYHFNNAMMRLKRFISLLTMAAICTLAGAQEVNKAKELFDTMSKYFSLKAYGQFAYEYESKDKTNSFYTRRIILFGNVNLHKRLELFYMFSAASGFKPLEVGGKIKICDEFNVSVGQMKVPYTMQAMMSLSKDELIEGALPANYIANVDASDEAYSGGTSHGGRDFGIMIEGSAINIPSSDKKLLDYKVGLFNGQGINQKDKNNHKDVCVYLALNPLSCLKVTGGTYLGKARALADRPEDRIVNGTDYTRNRWFAGFQLTTKPVMLRAEYLEGKNNESIARGAYATTMVRMWKNLDLLGSVAYLKKNKDAHGDTYRYVAGVEYRFFARCRFQLQYQREHDNYTHTDNNQLITQLQLGF